MRRTTTIVTALLSCVAGLQIARGQSSDTGPTPGTAQPAGSAQPAGAGAPAPVVKLPEVDVIGATPLLGTGVPRDSVPAASDVLTPQEINRTGIPSLTGALTSAAAERASR